MSSSSEIVTLTVNPALDVSTQVEAMAPSHKLRCAPPRVDPGGGGINVSRVCRRLGQPTTAVAPLGGGFGDEIKRLLITDAIPTRAVPVDADTRQSVTVLDDSTGYQYRFVFPGSGLSGPEIAACRAATQDAARDSRVVVVSGSMPGGRGGGLVVDLVDSLPEAAVIVDTSGAALTSALRAGAYLVKPSARELAQITGAVLRTEAEVEQAARDLVAHSNVEVLVVSIGAGGALVVQASGETMRVRAPTVQVRSAVGAGDAMVGGLAAGLNRGWGLERSAALGVAAGTAAVLTEATELCHAAEVEELLPLVTVD